MNQKGSVDWLLFLSTSILVLFGFIMVYSASFPEGYYYFRGDGFFFLRKQVMAGLAGMAALIIASFIDYRIYRKLNKLMFVLAILATVLLFTAYGTEAYGAVRWIDIGGLNIQPSDIIKIAAVMYVAYYLEKNAQRIRTFKKGYVPIAVLIFFFCGTIALQRDLSTTFVLAMTLGVMYFCAGANLLHIAMTAFMAISVTSYLIINESYRMVRVISFTDPFRYRSTYGYQVVQSLLALGTGGLFGMGLGQSRQKFFYIPLAYNDFIFAVIGEELGFVGAFGVILFFVVLVWRGLRIAINASDLFGTFLAMGITCLIGIQAAVHIAVVSSSMPPTGIVLPFISAGGTSLLINMASIGVLLNISKNSV